MPRFNVPQYIEVEDKIFGPFSFKQFVYLLGGAAISFILWRLLPSFLAIIFILPILVLSLALTFYRVNKRPFISILESFVRFNIGQKLYVWKKEAKKKEKLEVKTKIAPQLSVPSLSGSKLKDIAWSLDINQESKAPPGELGNLGN